MERVLTPDEKLRRAEEIYYRKRGERIKQSTKTVNVPISNKRYMLKKMIIQIVICIIIYCSYNVIKNFNFIFSKDIVNKTNEILSYDVDFQDMYCKVANYINNVPYFKQETEEDNFPNGDLVEPTVEPLEDTPLPTIQPTETPIPQETVSKLEATEPKKLTQMEQDALDIKQNYSIITPLNGQITSRFGKREPTEIISEYHVGLDIGANTGTAIIASMEGKVIISQSLDGYGNCVQIQKDDVLTIYGHCSKLCVKVGEVVAQGQKIAEVGQTRKSNRTSFTF